jgi:glutamate/aspartate transport system substrate-binding protein
VILYGHSHVQEAITMSKLALAGILVVLLVSAGCASTSTGQGAAAAGTLDRIKATKTINLGYRDASVPFSFVGQDQKPTGYSVDLCLRVVEDLRRDLQLPDLAVKWTLVTVASRMPAVQNGTVDLECGSTTNTLSRQAQVDFSLTTFVTGASLLALKDTMTANLSGLRIAVIPGTTTERALKEAMERAQTTVQLVPVTDHAEGRTALEKKTADAYASDREILIGLALTAQSPASFALVDRYFSYEPYALMLRRGDPDFRTTVNRSLARLYRSGEIQVIYRRWLGALGAPDALQIATWAIEGLPE